MIKPVQLYTLKTLIVIETIGGIKYIHYMGYGYYNGEPQNKPYRWVDYTFLMCPLSEALKNGIDNWEAEHQEFVKQYIQDLSEDEMKDVLDMENHKTLVIDDVTEDTLCGTYWI